MAIHIFIAYARKDRQLLQELGKHLSSLQRQGLITSWFDGDIVEGSEWRSRLLGHLQSAQLILLLISPDFIASRFCYEIEMKEALKRHDAQEARVIPVLLRPVEWYGLPFARIQAVPENALPVTLWENRDAAFLDIIRRIRTSLKDLQTQPNNTAEREISMSHDETQKQRPLAEQHAQRPPAAWTMTNSIGNVSDGSIVTQGAHNSTIVYGHTPGKSESHEALLGIIADLVDKTNNLCNQYTTQQEDAAGRGAVLIDPAYLKWFMDVMWEIKQRAVPMPRPLLVRVQEVCERLRIPCFFT